MRERGREVRGVSGASRRKQEVARGKQEVAEASRARATPRLCLLAEEEEDKGEVGWAGWGGTGPAGGLHGRGQVCPSPSYFCSVLF